MQASLEIQGGGENPWIQKTVWKQVAYVKSDLKIII